MSETSNSAHRLNATVLGNTAKVSDVNAFDAIRVEAGAVSAPADAGILCLEEANNSGNSVQGAGFATGNDYDVLQRFATTMQLRGYTGSSTNTGQVASFLFAPPDGTGNNARVNHVFFIEANSSPGGGIVNTPGGAQCTQPSVPTLQ